MRKFGIVGLSVIAGLFAAGASAQAAPIVIDDTGANAYWGGNDGSWNADIVGDSGFEIFSLSADKVGANLVVVVNTNFVDGYEGNSLGALFIGNPAKLNLNDGNGGAGTGPHYNDDIYKGAVQDDTDRFSYAFDFDASGNTGTLYDLAENGSDVVRSYPPVLNAQIRKGQAVDVNGFAVDSGVDGTWSIGGGQITFTIKNFFNIATIQTWSGLTLAWAMSCANDVVLGVVQFPGGNIPDVPVPASMLLLFSGLAGLGFLGRRRMKASSAA